jgi:hypothetical protein
MNRIVWIVIFLLSWGGSIPIGLHPGSVPEAYAGEVRTKFDNVTLDFGGYTRLRSNLYHNFDLDGDTDIDRANTFWDVRSSFNMTVHTPSVKVFTSIDAAGNDFTDGVVLGHDQPQVLREWELNVDKLYLQWDNPAASVFFGRQSAVLGRGIVSHVRRDSLRLVRSQGPLKLVGVWVAGGEGNTQTQPEGLSADVLDVDGDGNTTELNEFGSGNQTLAPVNSPEGFDDDLDAFVVMGIYGFRKLQLQGFWAQQFDSTSNDRNPQKGYLDLNLSGQVGEKIDLWLEGAYMFGETARIGNDRQDIRAYMFFLDFDYRVVERGTLGFRFGWGSGDDDPTNGDAENFQNLFMDETGFKYTNVFADDIWGYDYAAAGLGGSSLARGSGFSNINFYQVKGGYRFTERLNSLLSFTYLRLTEERVEGGGSPNSTLTGGPTTHDVGFEVDLDVDYKINPYTNLFLKSGWFEPGDLYAKKDGAGKVEVGFEFMF